MYPYIINPYNGQPIAPPARVKPVPEKAINKPRLLNSEQAADYLDLKKGTLINWRCTKQQQIPYIKIGGRVRYRVQDLDKWLEKQLVAPEGWDDE
jgi:excisionase family DNA binding protein